MTRQFTKMISTLCLMFIATLASRASADNFEHLDRLSQSLERRSNKIVQQTSQFRHTPEFAHLYTDATEIARSAHHIHDLIHQSASLRHIESDLHQIDAKLNHMKNVIRQIEHDAAFGHGHIHGNTNRIKRLMHFMEDDVHHMHDDVRDLQAPVVYPYGCPTQRLYAPEPHYGHEDDHHDHFNRNRFSFSIGGGSSRITFGL